MLPMQHRMVESDHSQAVEKCHKPMTLVLRKELCVSQTPVVVRERFLLPHTAYVCHDVVDLLIGQLSLEG